MKKAIIGLLLMICWTIPISTGVQAAEKQASPNADLVSQAKSAILIERDTGTILYEKNVHQKLPPASMTKIMTMLLIMDAIDQGKLKWNEKVRASEYAASMGGSQIFLEPSEEMTVDELMRGIAIGSGNDAAVAMAERIAGSEKAFVEMMNKKAKQMGLKDTVFKNATGLPAEGHYSSAYDMAMMAKELLKYDEVTKYTGKYEDYLRENTDKKILACEYKPSCEVLSGSGWSEDRFHSGCKILFNSHSQKRWYACDCRHIWGTDAKGTQ